MLIAAIGAGAVMVMAGFLLPRVSGDIELSAKGLKTTVQEIPVEALVLARTAAEAAIPPDDPSRDEKATDALLQALGELRIDRWYVTRPELDHLIRRGRFWEVPTAPRDSQPIEHGEDGPRQSPDKEEGDQALTRRPELPDGRTTDDHSA